MDPISNMITAIRNAGFAGHEATLVPYSKIKESIAEVLAKEGFLKSVKKVTKGGKNILELSLHVDNRVPKVQGVKRLSKPGKRVYKKYSELRPVRQGYGALVISTPKGVMSGRTAKREKVGGEVLFSIW